MKKSMYLIPLFLIFLVSCKEESKAVEITAEDVIVEFDGNPHGIEAQLSIQGGLLYEYLGIDNSYKSSIEPTQPGEYSVSISYKPSSLEKYKEANKTVKLTITLPYTISADGTEISNYTGNIKNIVIPSSYKRKEIKTIADNTFSGKEIMSLQTPKNEFSVNPAAFYGCINFEKLIISENTKLLSGQYPSGTIIEYFGKPTTLNADAYGAIEGIDELTIPETIMSIEDGALSKIGINKLILSSKLSLESQNLSNTITSVEVYPFEEHAILADRFFKDCINIQNIILRKGIIGFGEKAFYNTEALRTLELEDNIEMWGEETFTFSGLTTIKYNGTFRLSDRSLPETLVNIEILSGTTELTDEAFSNMAQITKVTLPLTLETIGVSSFSGCTSLPTLILPENLKSIGNCAFNKCTSLITITLPDSIESMGYEAFARCEKLKTINIPTSLSSISNRTFMYCYSLETIIIPANIQSIGEWCFNGCSSLKAVSISNGLQDIERGAFRSTSIEELELPETVVSIAPQAFELAIYLKKLTIFASIPPIIENSTFFKANEILIIYVPESAYSLYMDDLLWNVQNIDLIGSIKLLKD